MSGPKVVRIVTREEVQAICRGHLAELETAIARIKECASKHDALTEQLANALEATQREFMRLYEQDRWMEIQKQAPAQIVFLKEKAASISSAAIERATSKRQRLRHLADAARTISSALTSAGLTIPESASSVLTKAASHSTSDVPSIEGAINQALKILKGASIKPTSPEQDKLLQRLRTGESATTVAEWMMANTPQLSAAERRLETLIAEIATLGDNSNVQDFTNRISEAYRERSPDRKALLIDSLSIELSNLVVQRRNWDSAQETLLSAIASLKHLKSAESAETIGNIQIAIDNKDTALAKKITANAHALIAKEMARQAASARRKAVLDGLTSLGYEVRENMATAWAQSGRIVVRKPGNIDYGVELGAPAATEAMQVRLVGAANPSEARTAARDRDAETIWCSDFDKLRRTLAANGTEIKIERALAVGAQPVKTCQFDDVAETFVADWNTPTQKNERRSE